MAAAILREENVGRGYETYNVNGTVASLSSSEQWAGNQMAGLLPRDKKVPRQGGFLRSCTTLKAT